MISLRYTTIQASPFSILLFKEVSSLASKTCQMFENCDNKNIINNFPLKLVFCVALYNVNILTNEGLACEPGYFSSAGPTPCFWSTVLSLSWRKSNDRGLFYFLAVFEKIYIYAKLAYNLRNLKYKFVQKCLITNLSNFY